MEKRGCDTAQADFFGKQAAIRYRMSADERNLEDVKRSDAAAGGRMGMIQARQRRPQKVVPIVNDEEGSHKLRPKERKHTGGARDREQQAGEKKQSAKSTGAGTPNKKMSRNLHFPVSEAQKSANRSKAKQFKQEIRKIWKDVRKVNNEHAGEIIDQPLEVIIQQQIELHAGKWTSKTDLSAPVAIPEIDSKVSRPEAKSTTRQFEITNQHGISRRREIAHESEDVIRHEDMVRRPSVTTPMPLETPPPVLKGGLKSAGGAAKAEDYSSRSDELSAASDMHKGPQKRQGVRFAGNAPGADHHKMAAELLERKHKEAEKTQCGDLPVQAVGRRRGGLMNAEDQITSSAWFGSAYDLRDGKSDLELIGGRVGLVRHRQSGRLGKSMAMTAIKELEKAVVREMWVNHGEPPAIVDETNKDRQGKETPKRKLTITDFRGMIPDPFHHDEASLESTEKLNRVRFKTI